MNEMIIRELETIEKVLKYELVNNPMDKDTRQKKVDAVESVGKAINSLKSIY